MEMDAPCVVRSLGPRPSQLVPRRHPLVLHVSLVGGEEERKKGVLGKVSAASFCAKM